MTHQNYILEEVTSIRY